MKARIIKASLVALCSLLVAMSVVSCMVPQETAKRLPERRLDAAMDAMRNETDVIGVGIEPMQTSAGKHKGYSIAVLVSRETQRDRALLLGKKAVAMMGETGGNDLHIGVFYSDATRLVEGYKDSGAGRVWWD